MLVLGVMFSAGVAEACSTPVYRYAMLNWTPAPYRVFYFPGTEALADDEPANKLLRELSGPKPGANLVLDVVDVAREEWAQRLPEVVRKAREAHGDKPVHLVFTPWGVELFGGRLDEKMIRSLVESPVRKRIGELLGEGHAAVLLILVGRDENANRQVEKAVADVIARAAAGEIPTAESDDGMARPEDFLPKPAGSEETAEPNASAEGRSKRELKIAMLRVARDDPAESWLVRSLLAVEPDLAGRVEDSMVFGVFGRGRTMLPLVGKGITTENLTEAVKFLGGACSCIVKDENPGVDLLMQWDWQATAVALEAQDQGDRSELMGDRDAVAERGSLAELDPADRGGAMPKAEPAKGSDESGVRGQEGNQTGDHSTAAKGMTADVGGANAEDGLCAGQSESFAARQIWKLAVGLTAGAVLVICAGLILIRRQRVS